MGVTARKGVQGGRPEVVGGGVFGVLNRLVSLGSFVPIIAVGPIADAVGATNTLLGVGVVIVLVALASIVRGPRRPARG